MTIEIRDTLFGDLPFAEWPGDDALAEAEPWRSFAKARREAEAGNEAAAKATLNGILNMEQLEARHYLQAWHFLRSLGEAPGSDQAKRVYGVVVEVAMPEGLDIVAAYEDLSARYFNYSGAAVIWEHPNGELDEQLEQQLEAGRMVVAQIGPWEGERPGPPPEGQARISMLTPSGIHFGQAPLDALAGDPMGGRVIGAAINLMQALIAKTDQGNS